MKYGFLEKSNEKNVIKKGESNEYLLRGSNVTQNYAQKMVQEAKNTDQLLDSFMRKTNDTSQVDNSLFAYNKIKEECKKNIDYLLELKDMGLLNETQSQEVDNINNDYISITNGEKDFDDMLDMFAKLNKNRLEELSNRCKHLIQSIEKEKNNSIDSKVPDQLGKKKEELTELKELLIEQEKLNNVQHNVQNKINGLMQNTNSEQIISTEITNDLIKENDELNIKKKEVNGNMDYLPEYYEHLIERYNELKKYPIMKYLRDEEKHDIVANSSVPINELIQIINDENPNLFPEEEKEIIETHPELRTSDLKYSVFKLYSMRFKSIKSNCSLLYYLEDNLLKERLHEIYDNNPSFEYIDDLDYIGTRHIVIDQFDTVKNIPENKKYMLLRSFYPVELLVRAIEKDSSILNIGIFGPESSFIDEVEKLIDKSDIEEYYRNNKVKSL